MEDLDLFAKFALHHIALRDVEEGYNWEDEEFLPVPPNEFPPKLQNAATYVAWLYDLEKTFTVGFRS
jgi:hypothetical protein